MTKLLTAVLALTLACASTAAHAGAVVEFSLGKGGRLGDTPGWEPTNVMLAPGYRFLGMVRAQLGIVGELGDVKNGKFDLQLRPMLGLYPPIIPLYARAIFAFEHLLHSPRAALGGAAGLDIGLPFTGLHVFGEVAFLPQFVSSRTETIIEGRAGAALVF